MRGASRWLAALVISVLPAAVLAAPGPHGEAAGHGGGGCADMQWFALQPDAQGRVGFFWVLVNFAVLMLVLNKLLFSKLRAGHARDRERIKGELERATRAREQAEALMAELSSKLDRLAGEKQAILDEARRSAEADKKRLLEQAELEAQAIRDAATTAAELESERRHKEIEAEIIDRAIAAAENAIRAKLVATDQRKMIDDHVREVATVRLGEERTG